MTNNTNRIRATYGVDETFGLEDGLAYHRGIPADEVTLAEVAQWGARISRVRILAEAWSGIYRCDISYIHASRDGVVRRVRVDMEGSIGGDLWGKQGLKSRLIAWAKAEGVNAREIGLLDEGNWSILK